MLPNDGALWAADWFPSSLLLVEACTFARASASPSSTASSVLTSIASLALASFSSASRFYTTMAFEARILIRWSMRAINVPRSVLIENMVCSQRFTYTTCKHRVKFELPATRSYVLMSISKDFACLTFWASLVAAIAWFARAMAGKNVELRSNATAPPNRPKAPKRKRPQISPFLTGWAFKGLA